MRLRPKGLRSLRFGEAAFLFNNSFKTTGCRVIQHPDRVDPVLPAEQTHTCSEMPEAEDTIQRKTETSKKERLVVKTLFLSDIHLGTPDSKVAEVTHVVRNTVCDHLVLNGDIIDGWALGRQGSKWTATHTYFLRCVPFQISPARRASGLTHIIVSAGNWLCFGLFPRAKQT